MNSLVKNYIHRKLDISAERSQAVLTEWANVHKEAFYNIDTSRERMSPALSKTRAYHLRRPAVATGFIQKTTSAQNVLECADTALYATFPVMREFVNWVGQEFYGGWTKLGRIFVTRLGQDSNIGKHIDEGAYFESLHRHHFVLISQSAHFCWENDVQMQLQRGELWVVNNSIPHWVTNSGAPRTHIIFDAA
jgi:Aspartyl/Asparaginyl beta-hydroxylase